MTRTRRAWIGALLCLVVWSALPAETAGERRAEIEQWRAEREATKEITDKVQPGLSAPDISGMVPGPGG